LAIPCTGKEIAVNAQTTMLDTRQLTDLFRLDGKVALVAGGYGGIGEAICRAFAAFGATVAISGRSKQHASALAMALMDAGHSSYATTFDILNVGSIRRHVDEVAEALGRIDILVNCVGAQREERAEEVSEETWDYVSDVNLKGAFFLSQAVGRHQLLAKSGRQIHLSSVRSQLALRGRGYTPYCSTKGGLNLLIKQLAAEWAPHDILVNGIAPTFTRTEFVRSYLEDETFYANLVSRIPLQRIAEPLDCAGAALFLAGPASSFITGQILTIDGGITATQ
jgi:NAD(P)-dependent dehydrogenase (short-subunit alcohol dehydrogenase family)